MICYFHSLFMIYITFYWIKKSEVIHIQYAHLTTAALSPCIKPRLCLFLSHSLYYSLSISHFLFVWFNKLGVTKENRKASSIEKKGIWWPARSNPTLLHPQVHAQQKSSGTIYPIHLICTTNLHIDHLWGAHNRFGHGSHFSIGAQWLSFK